jgi:hypothetical protein
MEICDLWEKLKFRKAMGKRYRKLLAMQAPLEAENQEGKRQKRLAKKVAKLRNSVWPKAAS